MTQYNVPALEKLRESIEFEAALGKHDQGTWGRFRGRIKELFDLNGFTYASVSCPSAACAAGWTTINEGAKMLFPVEKDQDAVNLDCSDCLTPDGRVVDISEYAGDILGLDEDDRLRLFAGDSTTETVLRYIDELIVAAKHNRSWDDQRALSRY